MSSNKIAEQFIKFINYIINLINKDGEVFHTNLGNPTYKRLECINPTPEFLKMIREIPDHTEFKLYHLLQSLPHFLNSKDRKVSFNKYTSCKIDILAELYINSLRFINEKIDHNGSISFADAGNKTYKCKSLNYNPLREYLDKTNITMMKFASSLPPCYMVENNKILYVRIIPETPKKPVEVYSLNEID